MQDRYLYRKILSSAIVMFFFGAVTMVSGGMLGYYWNALQGHISGTSAGSVANGMTGFFGSSAIFLIVLLPVLVFATLANRSGNGYRIAFPYPLILLIPMTVYLLSGVMDLGKVRAVGKDMFNIYTALDNAVYIPFAVIGFVATIYFLLVIFVPSTIGTKIFGILTALTAIVHYAAYALFLVYRQMMSVLGGTFTSSGFAIYLVCFACDAICFFFMLSVLMTWCAIKREERGLRAKRASSSTVS